MVEISNVAAIQFGGKERKMAAVLSNVPHSVGN